MSSIQSKSQGCSAAQPPPRHVAAKHRLQSAAPPIQRFLQRQTNNSFIDSTMNPVNKKMFTFIV